MAVYVLTWNLNKEGRHYSEAREALLQLLAAYDCLMDDKLETVAFISTDEDAEDISEHVADAFDDNDRYFVTRIHSNDYQGQLTSDMWGWISDRL